MMFKTKVPLTKEQRVALHERIINVTSYVDLVIPLGIKYTSLKQRMYGTVMFSDKEYQKLIEILEYLEGKKDNVGGYENNV